MRRNVFDSVRDADLESPRILLARVVLGLIEVCVMCGEQCIVLKYSIYDLCVCESRERKSGSNYAHALFFFVFVFEL